MTKKEMIEKLAYELKELTDLYWEINDDYQQAKKDNDEDQIERYKRWRTKTLTRMNQTKKIAEMFGLSADKLEKLAFDLAVQAARQEA